jgi:hypothetical protein
MHRIIMKTIIITNYFSVPEVSSLSEQSSLARKLFESNRYEIAGELRQLHERMLQICILVLINLGGCYMRGM